MSKQIKPPFACVQRCIKSYIMQKSALMQAAVMWVGLIGWTREINESTLSSDMHEQSVQTFTGDLTAISMPTTLHSWLPLLPHSAFVWSCLLCAVSRIRNSCSRCCFQALTWIWRVAVWTAYLYDPHLTRFSYTDYRIYFSYVPEKDCPNRAASSEDRRPQLPKW